MIDAGCQLVTSLRDIQYAARTVGQRFGGEINFDARPIFTLKIYVLPYRTRNDALTSVRLFVCWLLSVRRACWMGGKRSSVNTTNSVISLVEINVISRLIGSSPMPPARMP